jgi:hypothetical protein
MYAHTVTPVARVSTYLNFPGTTMAAFEFHREVFPPAPISRHGPTAN